MKQLFTCIIAFSLFSIARAQDYPLVLDRQGTFSVIDWGIYTHWDCGFTKEQTSAHLHAIDQIIDSLRSVNPVLRELKGFDGQARLYAQPCDTRFHYGIPGLINFEFCTFYQSKGKVVRTNIEPPGWTLQMNQLCAFDACRYKFTLNEPRGNAGPGFDFKKWKKAYVDYSELFFTPGPKETISPGVDVYDGYKVVVYNPDRPAYWLPVSIREVYELMSAYYRLGPDDPAKSLTLQMIEQEWGMLTESEKDKPAYLGGRIGILKVGPEENTVQMVKANPAYWNRDLPKSAIQLLSFELPAKKYLQSQADEALQRHNLSYHVYRYLLELDPTIFTSFIKK
jgi:hypothetical protein